MSTKKIHYLDDLVVGQRFGSGSAVVTAEAIKSFAAEYDPQPFHLDEAAAAGHKLFKGLAASGWHTAAITMRLFVDSDFALAGGLIGAGLELQWPQPVRPGDELSVETEVLEITPSTSRPDRGRVKIRVTTRNQRQEPVQIYVASLVAERKVD